mmetsp:Transcript_25360/g.40684  ORF Transcript_25360/g.40684 Transcript_25360/m.40684 type:complete len:120 (+) Transcript_25360:947-1306(+)
MMMGSHYCVSANQCFFIRTFSSFSFNLDLQHFLELMRNRDVEGALKFARKELASHGNELPVLENERLLSAMGLIAYDDVSASPASHLLDEKHRSELAELVINGSQFSSEVTRNKYIFWF